MADNELYSAYHWAKKAEAWARHAEDAAEVASGVIIASTEEALEGFDDSKAISPLKLSQVIAYNVGRGIQLGFNGTLSEGVITFENTGEDPYTLQHNFDYELDLLFEGAGVLDDDLKVVIKNGDETFNILSVFNSDVNDTITFGKLKQACRYDAEIGWRWMFNARYTVTAGGAKVFIIPSAVADSTVFISERVQDCILENPDRIQYSTDGATLYIEAGSLLSFPDGSTVKVASKITHTIEEETTQVVFSDGTSVFHIDEGQVFASDTAPTGYDMMLWYDTTNKVIKYTGDAGANWTGSYTYPIALANNTGVSKCFCNGTGGCANFVWVVKGVKVLIPNGKTTGGLFNNISYTVLTDLVKTFTDTATGVLVVKSSGVLDLLPSLVVDKNNYAKDGDTTVYAVKIADMSTTTGKVSNYEERGRLKLATTEVLDNLWDDIDAGLFGDSAKTGTFYLNYKR